MTAYNTEPVSSAEFYAGLAAKMSEDELQTAVIKIAEQLGWLIYHTHNSKRSQPGFPDLTMVHEASGRLMFRELKSMKGTWRPMQREWLQALRAVGIDADVWRPDAFYSRRIHNELAPRPLAA